MTAQDHLDIRNKHRLSIHDYLLLDREGVFGDRRTELFGGEVYYMSPKHRPHARAVTRLVIALENAIGKLAPGLGGLTDVSVSLSDNDVPEPDIVITDAPDGEGLLPLGAVKLLIEVSDSTFAQDMGAKATLYAGAGVPEYWVVDVNGRTIYQMSSPADGTYLRRREIVVGGPIEAATIAGLLIDTASL